MPAIAAMAYHRASGRNFSQPNQRMSYSENFLYMLDAANKPGYKPNPRCKYALLRIHVNQPQLLNPFNCHCARVAPIRAKYKIDHGCTMRVMILDSTGDMGVTEGLQLDALACSPSPLCISDDL